MDATDRVAPAAARARTRARPLAAFTSAVIAVVAFAACGNAAPAQTVGREPDLALITLGDVPRGLSGSTLAAVQRLQPACTAIDTRVGAVLPDIAPSGTISSLIIEDAECQWLGTPDPSARPPFPPELIVGIVDGGSSRFAETVSVLTDERTVSGVGDEAAFDPQTRTLYTVRADRLWYVQLVGTAPRGAAAQSIATTVARALMATTAAR
jgi:hypothetical protein